MIAPFSPIDTSSIVIFFSLTVAEVLGLYGLIVALILNTRTQDDPLGCYLSK